MMSSSASSPPNAPIVDARLVASESGYEIVDGRIVAVPPADEPHGERHSKVNALLEAFVTEEYNVACDMLTRTSQTSDIAPGASVYPAARDPNTGGRQLEVLAFEIVSTQQLSDAADKARRLHERGVRRVFAVHVSHQRVFEWSRDADTWQVLPDAGAIEDPSLVAPLSVEALVKSAKADDAVARALLIKRNPVIAAALTESETRGEAAGEAKGEVTGRARGEVEGVRNALFTFIQARGLSLIPQQRRRIEACADVLQLYDWTVRAATADTGDDIFE
jgi:Uma2 family endonuclease